jgi:hypothetical protein
MNIYKHNTEHDMYLKRFTFPCLPNSPIFSPYQSGSFLRPFLDNRICGLMSSSELSLLYHKQEYNINSYNKTNITFINPLYIVIEKNKCWMSFMYHSPNLHNFIKQYFHKFHHLLLGLGDSNSHAWLIIW